MPCVSYRWIPGDEKQKASLLAALRSNRTRLEAAKALGRGVGALDRGCQVHGIKTGAELGADLRKPPPKVDEAPPQVEVPPPAPLDWTGARPQVTGSGLERRLLLGDLHIPFHDLRACSAALAVARAIQPHVIIQLGDLFNMGAVSHHPAPPGGAENHGRAMLQGRAFIEALHRAAPGAEIVVLLGNHDSWTEEYELNHPELAGLLGLEWLTKIATVIPRRRQPYVRGPVAYTHGYGGGEMAAKKYAIEVAPAVGVKYVRAAHHHTLQCHQARNGCEGWIVGWLGRGEEAAFDYAKNRDHWRKALCIDDVMGDRATLTPVRLDGGAALFGGQLIAA